MNYDSETAEAEWVYLYGKVAPAALGATVARIREGVVLHMRFDPIDYWSQALGFTEPVTADLLDEILEHYRRDGARTATLHFSPDLLPPDFSQLAAERGLVATWTKAKLGGKAADVKTAPTDFRIAPVTEGDAAEFGEVVLTGFGAPGTPLSEMIEASVGAPNCYPFAAWDGDTMVAGGNLLVHGEIGALHSGSTLPDYRGRGAQSALISARAEAARKAGCRWVVAETGLSTPEQPNSSYNNMRRAGLAELYQRVVWRWTAPEA
ncbi:GNAT family N-acetyltransferase [Dactylosporangium sp. NPDC049140]|uniref:GNAT family N-acetyltransferase n=1 Tax=Dactylosporangium sp. NPDC049140 TaxID=3155647 RepID=UPI00340A7B89